MWTRDDGSIYATLVHKQKSQHLVNTGIFKYNH